MSVLDLKKEGNVHIVTMTNGDNTFTEAVLKEHMKVVDELSKTDTDTAVVLTSNDPKFWCNGINLPWLMSQGADYVPQFKDIIDEMLVKWATLKIPTIACMTGHAYAGGAILSCCFDFRFMRADRGFFCFPEVDVNIPFTDIMHRIINVMPQETLRDLALTGRRIGGEEAARLGVVNAAYAQEELQTKVMELASMLATKNRATYSAIKDGLKRELIQYIQSR